jgi:8-oxo-dGTP diphosphatase
MKTLKDLEDFLINGHLHYRPEVTVDCAIFGYRDGELQLLLVKNKLLTKWCLPGGHVKKTENLDQAANRIAIERTGIANLFLKQFKTFGGPERDNRPAFNEAKFLEITQIAKEKYNWLLVETVSIGFYSITDIVNVSPQTDFLSSECRWFPVNKLPKLGFDHDEMVREAIFTMRIHLYHFPIGKNLLPQKFTLKEIKLFYETMSGKKLNATNFPNKLISLGLIVKTNEKKNIGGHRSPTYYKFDNEAYKKALREGLVLV